MAEAWAISIILLPVSHPVNALLMLMPPTACCRNRSILVPFFSAVLRCWMSLQHSAHFSSTYYLHRAGTCLWMVGFQQRIVSSRLIMAGPVCFKGFSEFHFIRRCIQSSGSSYTTVLLAGKRYGRNVELAGY